LKGYPHLRRSTSVEGIVNTLDWLLIALILALVFRAFAVEAFQIPTGSMAETLNGAHRHLRCLRCSFAYNVGGDTASLDRPQCPNCGYRQPAASAGVMANGDRIFVNKCIYQFSPPKRWDVVVFKNPPNPQENYIKRLIALPEETVEIIDGDIYIDGAIARKPRNVQNELWMCIYRNDYQPMEAAGRFQEEIESGTDRDNEIWQQAWVNEPNSRWDLQAAGPAVLILDAPPREENTLRYVPRGKYDFASTYAYNDSRDNAVMPVCSDLMVRFLLEPGSQEGSAGAVLEKNGVLYAGRFSFFGQLTLERIDPDGTVTELSRLAFRPRPHEENNWFEFANVDRRLVVRYGSYRLSKDLSGMDAAGTGKKPRSPVVRVVGSGKLTVRHLGLYRDIFYLTEDARRAGEGNPFTLGADEYFVCGDNSPNSFDSRGWVALGLGNNGKTYTAGIVPGDFLMGKAFYVYWSQAFRPQENMLPVIPNLENLHVIYGGSEELY
jgi:signal peptidase I